MSFKDRLGLLSNADFKEWGSGSQSREDSNYLFIVASGYEARAIEWSRILNELYGFPQKSSFLVLAFDTYSDHPVRRINDSFFRQITSNFVKASGSDSDGVVSRVASEIRQARIDGKPLEIHIDYSSMSRCWYCNLARELSYFVDTTTSLYFWYTPGAYSSTNFPSAGVRDFQLFSGEPTLARSDRVHIFGLGYDKVRSQAIHSVLDPSRFLCFYADPGARASDAETVRNENEFLLSMAMDVFTVPLNDFVKTFSRIREKSMLFKRRGDVVLVPDGPKPMIMATSLVPDSLDEDGISCFHVGRRSQPGEFLSIEGTQLPFGFKFSNSSLSIGSGF